VDYDHETALADGGKHSEANLRAKHRRCHKLKTAREAQDRAINGRKVAHHYGLKQPSRGFYRPPGTKFDWQRGRYVRD
jgi:5-methylcytosine-specific restriction enzyme A